MSQSVIICPTCRTRWPGHSVCPECGAEMVELKVQASRTHVSSLTQFEDLAVQYDIGQRTGAQDRALSWPPRGYMLPDTPKEEKESLANPILKPGDKAPDFTATLDDESTVSLESLSGRRVVLYFYPKDDTPGCTTQACDFRDNLVALGNMGVEVYGVSPDSVASHQKFKTKHNLTFPLIADTDKSLAEAYGVWREKKNYGRTYMGIVRSTFVIGPDGTLEIVQDNVRAKGHVARLVKSLG